MLDYKLLEAFYFVVKNGGFEKAATALCITQSAVSQRVKLLEEQVGKVLLLRSSPPKATIEGDIYINHYLNVSNLEQGINIKSKNSREIIKIGINADSLETWFMPLAQKLLPQNALLELKLEDQDKTIDYLKNGEVVATISSWDKGIQGCSMDKIGSMRYRMLGTDDFKDRWFKDGLTLDNICKAPAVLFNTDDNLHDYQLKSIFKSIPIYPKNYIPSSEQFLNFILNGYGYGLVPDLQSEKYIKERSLIDLTPNKHQVIELYLHHWNYMSNSTKIFVKRLKEMIKTENIIL